MAEKVSGPGPYSKRTDRGQTPKDIPNAAYGEQAEFQNIQGAAKMAKTPMGSPAGMPPKMPQITPLSAPTERPDEHWHGHGHARAEQIGCRGTCGVHAFT